MTCDALCDAAGSGCGWLDPEEAEYAQARAQCVALCEAETECVTPAMDACDVRAFDACFLSPDETAACTAMCDHVYYDCTASLGVSRADCGVGCSRGDFSEAEVACFTTAACDFDSLAACFGAGPAPDACEVACDHVVDECGNDSWNRTSCVRACRASYSAGEVACLAGLACDADPIETCFGKFSCAAMCNHVYNECGSAIGDGSREDCEALCFWGLFSDTEITCFSGAACADLEACDETLQQPE